MTSMTTEPISPDQAMLIMLFWSLGCEAIGYGVAVWRYGRKARRAEARKRRDLERLALEALAASGRDG